MRGGRHIFELNNVYHMDCVEGMRQLPDDFVDLTVTSPPYDDLRKYNGYSFDFENVARELYRITKPGGVLVWVVGDKTKSGSETLTSFKQSIFLKEECGILGHDTMIYRKTNPIPLTHNRYEQEFEFMFVFSKGKPKTFNPLMVPCSTAGQKYDYSKRQSAATFEQNGAGRNRNEILITKDVKQKGNIWSYTVGNNKSTRDKIAFQHPAIFPEQLATDHIVSWSNESDLVFDPMCGSGTTLKMAKQLNRQFLGFDISGEYVAITKQRII